jgi:predicted unusual protein kinase regulating ubiquinone biosynthesis (AarF/ABC1/UbiB family)
MQPLHLRTRYLRILSFFAGVIARFIYWELILRRLGFSAWVRKTRPQRLRKDAIRFRSLAIRMGGVMIKVGQFLSSRLDVLPAEVTDELANLQDEVPAENIEAILAIVEAELGNPAVKAFESFDAIPLAAASLGQVHRARLHPDQAESLEYREVVVKVQRPFIRQIVEVDLSALQRVGRWLMRYRPVREHADVPALLQEFSATLFEEIDYLHEADNAETFYTNFQDDPDVHVPRVVRKLSTLRVLTLEDVYAIKITDYAGITAAGIDRAEVATRLLDTYLKQIFEDGFVHADPHPGNLFVTPLKTGDNQPARWRLTFVDFGMVALVPDVLRDSLRELVIAVGTRDAGRVVRAYQQLDMLLPGADLAAIENAESQVFDRFWGLSMKELRNISPQEVRDFAHQFRDLMMSMPFQVPQNLLYLARTVAILSGMCAGLDPDFNLWTTLAPYARKLVQEDEIGGLDYWLEELGQLAQTLLALPAQTSRVLSQVEGRGIRIQTTSIEREMRKMTGAVERLSGSVVFAALLLGGIIFWNAGERGFSQAMIAAAVFLYVWQLLTSRRK